MSSANNATLIYFVPYRYPFRFFLLFIIYYILYTINTILKRSTHSGHPYLVPVRGKVFFSSPLYDVNYWFFINGFNQIVGKFLHTFFWIFFTIAVGYCQQPFQDLIMSLLLFIWWINLFISVSWTLLACLGWNLVRRDVWSFWWFIRKSLWGFLHLCSLKRLVYSFPFQLGPFLV